MTEEAVQEISRRVIRQEAPQMVRVLTSPEWSVDIAVWHDATWERIPDDVIATLLNLKATVAALRDDRVRRFEVRCERR